MGQPVVHFQIMGRDADKAQRYYADLFGWEVERLPYENPTDYGLVAREGNTNPDGAGIGGGIGGSPEGMEPSVTFFVEVPDVEAALAKAESLGGARLMGPDQVPDGPLIGMFGDPDGNAVGVLQAEAT